MFRIAFILSYIVLPLLMSSQYDWRLEKDKSGIQVYSSKVPDSEFRATKVECTLDGSYEKLISVISDVSGMTDWVYKSSSCEIVETYATLDFLYTVVTEMPWPMDDRESVIHLQFQTENLPDSMTIIGTEAEEPIPEKPDLIRVSNYQATWKVTMPEEDKIHIEYILKLDPGGGIPPWMANIMVEKGPYETFKGLSEKLKELD
ncbi:MAG: hypothetical protein HKN79_07410 [Flavobacteriales bacterium]|nr:hypothetical protein [Flavobacteriales bacterium]